MLQNLQLYNVRSTSCKLQSQFVILKYNYNLQLQCKIWFHLPKKITTTILNLISFVKKFTSLQNCQSNETYNLT